MQNWCQDKMQITLRVDAKRRAVETISNESDLQHSAGSEPERRNDIPTSRGHASKTDNQSIHTRSQHPRHSHVLKLASPRCLLCEVKSVTKSPWVTNIQDATPQLPQHDTAPGRCGSFRMACEPGNWAKVLAGFHFVLVLGGTTLTAGTRREVAGEKSR